MREAELRGRVEVDSGKLRLRAERLRVSRRDDGTLVLTGPLVVSTCPCDPPPLAVAAASVDVHPGGDVEAHDVSLRVAGVPVLWSPWLSLRAPTQLGLLPPTLAWRATDGPFAGAGVHVPLGAARSLDLHAGGYLRGTGTDTVATLETERARVRARWESLHGDRVAVAGRAAWGGAERVNASVDVARGAGLARSAVDLDTAVRRRDRVDVAVDASSVGASVFSYAARGDGARWSGLRVAAPLSASAGWGSVSAVADAMALTHGSASVSAARVEGGAHASAFAGPVRLDARLASGAWVTSDAATSGASGASVSAVVGADLPVARRYDGVVHVIDPGVAAKVIAVDERGGGLSLAPSPLSRGVAGVVSLPLTTLLGPPGRGALSAGIEPGALVREGGAVAVTQARVTAFGALLRGRAEAAVVARRTLVIARSEIGPTWLHAVGSIESLSGATPIEASALGFGHDARNARLAAPGATGRTGVGASRGALRADVARFWSYTTGEGLAEEATIGWRPACGCVDVAALGAHRVGRDGVDVMLTASLFR